MHTAQDDNLMVLQGSRYVDIFDPKTKERASFVVTPDKVYKNEKDANDYMAAIMIAKGG